MTEQLHLDEEELIKRDKEDAEEWQEEGVPLSSEEKEGLVQGWAKMRTGEQAEEWKRQLKKDDEGANDD